MFLKILFCVFQNLPQLALQIWFLFGINGGEYGNIIAISSLIFSLISIVISVMSMFMEKSLIDSQQCIVISMDITGNDVMAKIEKCKIRIKHIKKSICSLIGVDNGVTEILKPKSIPEGLRLEMYLYLNVEEKTVEFEKSLNKARKNGQLATIITKHWKLKNVPVVHNISVNVYESKEQRKHTKEIQNVQTEIQMNVVKGSFDEDQ